MKQQQKTETCYPSSSLTTHNPETHNVALIRDELKLLWHHEGRVAGLDEPLFVQPGIQLRHGPAELIHRLPLPGQHALLGVTGHQQSPAQGSVHAGVGAVQRVRQVVHEEPVNGGVGRLQAEQEVVPGAQGLQPSVLVFVASLRGGGRVAGGGGALE